MFKITSFLILASLLTFAGCEVEETTQTPTRTEKQNVEVTDNGVLEWFCKPAVVHFKGQHTRDYFGWLTNDKKVQIRYYDYGTRTWSEIVTIHTYDIVDDHGPPSILILPDGKILAFYALHNTTLYCRRSTRPEDISKWEDKVTMEEDGASYPKPIRLPNGDIVVIYRHVLGGGYFEEVYRVSKDNGANWGSRITLIDFGDKHVIYTFVAQGGNSIHLAWSVYYYEVKKEKNIFYIYSPDNLITWKKRDGTVIALPIDEGKADKVFATTPPKATWCWDIKLDEQNNPYIVFIDDNDASVGQARWAKYDNGWETYAISATKRIYDYTSQDYQSGVVLAERDVHKVFVGVPRDGITEIEEWQTLDNGPTWQKTKAITEGSTYDNWRPQVVRDRGIGLRLIWVVSKYYNHWTDYNSYIMGYGVRN